MLCDFIEKTRTCSRCGFVADSLPAFRNCPSSAGMGDMVAASLSAIGITKERVSAVVGGDCGCAKRQQALNDLGRKLGIGGS